MKKESIIALIDKFKLVIVLLIMIVTMTMLRESFLTQTNIENILQQISINVCLSLGMTLVIIAGGIDLSVGSILAFAGVVMAGLLKNGLELPGMNLLVEFSFHGALIVGLLVGSALGLFNGFMITAFKIPPFIATLAMLSIARGMTKLWTGGEPITNLGETLATVGWGKFLGIPIVVWIPAVLVVVFILITKKTRYGRHVYAIGGNEQAARFSGLPVARIKLVTYTLCGLMSAVAAVIMTARLDSATVVAGETFELNAIAAVVIGGTSLSGGRGTIMGTVLGCLIIGVLANSLVLLSVSPFWQQIIKGLVILLAIIVDKFNAKE